MSRPPRPGSCRLPSLGLLATAGVALACSRAAAPAPLGSAGSSATSPSASATPPPSAAPPPSGATSASTPVASAPPAATNVINEKSDAGVPGLVLGELFDIGPAGPATATPDGVVLLTKDDRLLVAKRTAGARADKAKIEAVDPPPSALAPLGRGPSVAAGLAYWVSHGRLVRRPLTGERAIEVLADDAREKSRSTAVELGGKVAVAFLGRADQEGTSHARLWLEGGSTLDLTPDGSGASSVSLARVGDHLLATMIDGRSAMTPMHARTVRLTATGVELGTDVVVWVGGPAQAWTETFVGAEAGRAWAHVPIERDVTHFGLASVDLGPEPHMDSEVAFFDYPNGIDLAPVSTAELCGRAHVAFVRPTTPAPRSPEELVLARLGTSELVPVANARGFASVSLASVPGGGLMAYVADARTWARGFSCH